MTEYIFIIIKLLFYLQDVLDATGAYALCGMHCMETIAKTSCLISQRAYEHWKAHNQSMLSTVPQSDYGKEKKEE